MTSSRLARERRSGLMAVRLDRSCPLQHEADSGGRAAGSGGMEAEQRADQRRGEAKMESNDGGKPDI